MLSIRTSITAAAQHDDAVVIGAGQAERRRRLDESGRTNALIEREHVGGAGINVKKLTAIEQ